MENNQYGKMPFYEVAEDFKYMIDYHIIQLHIKQSYDEYFQTGFYELWKAFQLYESKKGSFSSFVSDEIKRSLLKMKQEGCSFVYKDLFGRQLLLEHNIKDKVKAVDKDVFGSVLSNMTVNRWKWIYQYIILDLSMGSDNSSVSVG